MRIWLDDIRPAPDDTWEVARNPAEFLALIQYPAIVSEVSFDHDLGSTVTGSDLATALCERILDYGCSVPKWAVHSGNPCGRLNIEAKMRSLERIVSENL